MNDNEYLKMNKLIMNIRAELGELDVYLSKQRNTDVVKTITVGSLSKDNTYYQITKHNDGQISCTCPDYIYHKRENGQLCKHIIKARHEGIL